MKLILFFALFTLASCTQKYETYHVISKSEFNKDNYEAPVTKKMYPGEKVTKDYCEGQILFSSNAKKATDRALTNIVRTTCSDDEYLLNSKVTETWWTTLIYSRSCVELETYCPRKMPKR